MTMSKIHPDIQALVDLSKPSLQTLSFILRNKEFWPKDFEWDFENFNQCAMGLLAQIFHKGNYPSERTLAMLDFKGEDLNERILAMMDFNLSYSQVHALFETPGPNEDWKLSPAVIADRIDAFLAAKETENV